MSLEWEVAQDRVVRSHAPANLLPFLECGKCIFVDRERHTIWWGFPKTAAVAHARIMAAEAEIAMCVAKGKNYPTVFRVKEAPITL